MFLIKMPISEECEPMQCTHLKNKLKLEFHKEKNKNLLIYWKKNQSTQSTLE